MIYWLYGLSGAGKSTLAKRIKEINPGFVWLDADEVRKGINNNLGFTEEDRTENNRRIIEICKILDYNNISVVCSVITPFEEIRKKIKKELSCILIALDCSVNTCIKRDVKGLYKRIKARMTGLKGNRYDKPQTYDLKVNTGKYDVDTCLSKIRAFVRNNYHKEII